MDNFDGNYQIPDMELDIPTEHPHKAISAKLAWNPKAQALPELKAMFEESRRKGHASIGTILRCVRQLKTGIKTGEAEPDTQPTRTQSIHRIEKFLKENNLAPKLEDLETMRRRHNDLTSMFQEIGKKPYEWHEEIKSGKVDKARKEHGSLHEQIQYLEATPEFKELAANKKRDQENLWDDAKATLTPEEQKLLSIDADLKKIDAMFQEIEKDGHWKQETEQDGSYALWKKEYQALKELKGSPEEEAALKKMGDSLETLRKIRES